MHTSFPPPPTSTNNRSSLRSINHRRRLIQQCAAAWSHKWYDSQGVWISPENKPDMRKTVWLSFGLLAGDKNLIALANKILRHQGFDHHHPTRTQEEQNSQFDIFVTNHAVQMLVQQGAKLEADVRLKVEGWARHALKDYAGDRQCDYQFHGCNDNMPSKATLGMILGGEYFGDAEAVEHGLWNLRQLRDMLTRRGLVSEYTSPTYLPNTLLNLTEISLHARNQEARHLAAQCAERVWADFLGHFHAPTGTMGGPYSRAYQLDSTGHYSTAACMLWLALGDQIAFDPIEEINRDTIRLVHHHDERVTQLALFCWLASSPLQPPAYLLKWLQKREYPFQLHASAERGFETGGEVNTSFYAEEDFAVGTAEGEGWSETQSETFFLQFRRQAPMQGIEDLRTVYCRYLINDQKPGDRIKDHCLQSHAIVHTVQDKRVSLVLARPSLSLAGKNVQALKFSIILSEHFTAVEKIEIQDHYVFIHDGPVYLGLRGLNATDWGRKQSVQIERAPNYRLISFYNYQGDEKTFSLEELSRTLNGFVSIIGLESEESWDAFRARVKATEVLDYFYFGSRVVRCKAGETLLGMGYALQQDRVRFRTVNGLSAPRPAWQADGLPQKRLPFLTQPQPNSLELPFHHLRAVWAPNDKWMIASTGHARNQNRKPLA